MINLIDTTVYGFIIKFLNMPVTHFMRIITYFGSAQVLISICVITYILMKNKKIPTLISMNLFFLLYLM